MSPYHQGSLFESDKSLTGPIFTWIGHLLTSGDADMNQLGPTKSSIARQALLKILQSNLSLFDAYVNKCFDDNPEVASVYFQVHCFLV